MSFQDRTGTSVESLLAILRSVQGADPNASPAQAGPSTQPPATPTPVPAPAPAPAPKSPARANSGNASLSDLLAQLDQPPSSPPVEATLTPRRRSAFEGPSHDLIDPFGPVGTTPRRRESDTAAAASSSPRGSIDGGKGKGKRPAEDMEDREDWSFTRCLPVLTELLRDDAFVKEVRKMKSDQDALERRLWARMEKVKAEHKARGAAEREVARITRKPVPPETVAKRNRELKAALDELFRKQVLPSLDGLAARQHARLAELGVPGLGGAVEGNSKPSEAEAARAQRVKRIMGVLESVLDG